MADPAEIQDIWLVIKQVVERSKPLVKKTFGEQTVITHYDNMAPDGRDHHFILRLFLQGGTSPDTVILKYHARWGKIPWDDNSKETHRLANDYAGCYFLSQFDNSIPFSPKAYSIDLSQNLMLIEDIRQVDKNYVDVLLDDNQPNAEIHLSNWMRYLAQMHGQTSQRIQDYIKYRDELDKRNARDHELIAIAFQAAIPQIKQAFAAIDFSASDEFFAEYQTLVEIIREPGAFFGYVHGDPCPDNILLVNNQPQLIDFELSGAGLVLLDAVYPRMMYPTCWCVGQTSPELVEKLESIYRAELSTYIPSAADDAQWQKYLTAACGYWVIYTLNLKILWTGDLDTDTEWGISTQRKRIISRLKAFVDMATEFGLWPHLTTTFTELHQHLVARWEDSSDGLQLYPAMLNDDAKE